MSLIQSRAAVAPLRRYFSYGEEPVPAPARSVAEMVAKLRPAVPLHCIRPAVITAAANAFVNAFDGEVLYAVKCNPEPTVLRAIWAGGVRHFDCASIAEVTLVRRLFPG
jgi:ornithine decarboxylase